MKTKIISISIFCILIFTVITIYKYQRNLKYTIYNAKVTLRIIDYDHNPIENAKINAYFPNQLKGINKGKYCIGESDDDGMFVAKGKADFCLNYIITKKGYYDTSNEYSFSARWEGKGKQRLKWFPWIVRWTPWNPTLTVVLKKIRNPIAMKVREVEFSLPSKEQYYPFDLDIGDLVEPYGKGKKTIYIYIIMQT